MVADLQYAKNLGFRVGKWSQISMQITNTF